MNKTFPVIKKLMFLKGNRNKQMISKIMGFNSYSQRVVCRPVALVTPGNLDVKIPSLHYRPTESDSLQMILIKF